MESEPTKFRPRSFGQIVGDSFGTYFADIAKYIAIASIVIIPVALCSGGLWALGDFARTAADGWSTHGGDLVAILPYAVGTFLISMLTYPLMQGALIQATEQKRLGQTISISQAYHSALRHAGRLIGAWLLTAVLIALMMASLICFPFALFGGDRWLLILTAVLALGLPFAVYFTIRWLLVLQTVMLEESRVIESLHRSGAMVTGNWWRSLGIWVLLTLAPPFVVGMPVSLVLASWEQLSGLGVIVFQGIFPALVVLPVSTIGQTLLYFDLRARREQYISQIMGGGVEVPPYPKPEYTPQVVSAEVRRPGKLKLKPALIAIAVAVVLAAVIAPTVLYFHNRADAGDIQVFVKSLSTGKQVRLGHGKLKTFDPDIAFIVEFDGSIRAGDQENTIEIVGSSNDWSDGLARVRVYAEEGGAAEYYAPVQYGSYLPPEFNPQNELSITVEVLNEHEIQVCSTAGNLPETSDIALTLDYGNGAGWVARLFTL